MDLKIGDAVKLLNESAQGWVTAILPNRMVRVETTEGFEFDYPFSAVIRVDEEGKEVEFEVDKKQIFQKIREERVKKKSRQEFQPKRLKSYLDNRLVNAEGVIEIDLHLEELVEKPAALQEWQKIEVQLEHFRSCLEEAFQMKIGNLVFIHGKGQGRLKAEIRNALHAYPEVDYFDASYQRYGYGATQIKIRGLHT